jgi:hypothetical protein
MVVLKVCRPSISNNHFIKKMVDIAHEKIQVGDQRLKMHVREIRLFAFEMVNFYRGLPQTTKASK